MLRLFLLFIPIGIILIRPFVPLVVDTHHQPALLSLPLKPIQRPATPPQWNRHPVSHTHTHTPIQPRLWKLGVLINRTHSCDVLSGMSGARAPSEQSQNLR